MTIIFLLLLTPALLIWQHFGMTRVVEISPSQPHGARITDDHLDYGGDTVSSMSRTNDDFIVRCTLGEAKKYPYCKLQFFMGTPVKGVDLSRIESVVLDIRAAGPSPKTVKLHLLNFEPDISSTRDWTSQRYNEVIVDLGGAEPFEIPLKALHTADWWLGVHRLPLANSYARLENITAVELSTGNDFHIGKTTVIALRAIQFRSKWISQSALLMSLVLAWIVFGIFGLLNVKKRTAELRQQTRYLRTLIDTLPLWVWLKDTGCQYLAVNQAKAAACGHSVDAMVGKSDQQLRLAQPAGPHSGDDADVMMGCQHVTVEQAVPSAGGLVWMETYRAPVLDEDGAVLGMVGVARDISERKAAEAAREAALAEAVGLARQRSNFLAQMSHELRTPLNAIMGYAQLLQRDRNQLTEWQAASVATIHNSSQHLLTLINDILDLARVEAGKMVLYPTAANLSAFLLGVTDIMRVKAEEKGLRFNVDLAPGLPQEVTIDETRLRQVLINLLGNAVKFTDCGEVSLRVKARRPGLGASETGEAIASLCFEVADSGIGMSQQQLGRLFQPFEQVADVARRENGSGLGLAISQQLVRLMAGNISVTSEPDKGSVFWFELAVPVVSHAPAVQSVLPTITGYAGQPRRVLIVDDVALNRTMLTEMLQAVGFHAASACDGMECLALLDDFRPDLILMDVMMPGIDGNETTRRIRQLPAWRHIPIIAVSASASQEDEANCRAAGVDMFLAKPIDIALLVNAMGEQLSLDLDARPELPATEAVEDADGAELVIPPPAEIDMLWQLAQAGDMRTIRKQADYVAALDAAYAPFAQRLRTMAHGYQSLALVAFLERLRSDT